MEFGIFIQAHVPAARLEATAHADLGDREQAAVPAAT